MTQLTIMEGFSFITLPEKDSTKDPLFLAEYQLTVAELTNLMYKHGNKIYSPTSIKPFQTFLVNRWKRIAKTDLIYPHAPNQAATQLCLNVAKFIANPLPNSHNFKNNVICN